MNNKEKEQFKGYLFTIIGVICFGLTLPFTKEVIKEIEPEFLGWSRPFFAGIAAIIYILLNSSFHLPPLTKKKYNRYSLVILGMCFGFPFFSSLAMGKISASHGGVLLGILPVLITLVGIFLSKERPSWSFWTCCLFGSILVIIFSLLQGAGEFQIGDIYLLIAVFLASFGYAKGSILSKKENGIQVISFALILAIPINLIPTIYYFPYNFFSLQWSTYLYFLYVILISQYGAFFFFYKGAAIIGVARAGMFHLLQPFITILTSFFFFEKKFNWFTILFAFLVILVVYLSKKVPIYEKK